MSKSSTNPATAPTTDSVRSRVWAASRVPARLLAVARLSGIGVAIWLVAVIVADATLGFPGVAAYFHALTVGGVILGLGAATVVVPVELRIAFGHTDAAPAPSPVEPAVKLADLTAFVAALADQLTVADLDPIVAALADIRKAVKREAKHVNRRLDGQGADLQELRRVVDALGRASRNTRSSGSQPGGGTPGNGRRNARPK